MLFHAADRNQPPLTAAADVLGSKQGPQAETKTETETKIETQSGV